MLKTKTMSLFILLYLIFVFSFQAAAAPSTKIKNHTSKTAQNIVFLPGKEASTTIDNGVIVSFDDPDIGLDNIQPKEKKGFYSNYYGPFGYTYPVECKGVWISLKNTSDQYRVVRWAESGIAVGNYSGMLFIDGMDYWDAGKPSATPDTIVLPGQSVNRGVFIARAYRAPSSWFDKFGKHISWDIEGEPIPMDNSMTVTLIIKILDSDGKGKIYSVQSPCIGLPQEN